VAAALHLAELRGADAELGELTLDETERELARENRHLVVEVLQKIRQGTGVILVAVGDDDAAELVLVLKHIGIVGQHQVDAGLVVVGEHESCVDEHQVIAAFERGHVLADTIKTAQGNDLERGGGFFVVCHTSSGSFRLHFTQKRWGVPIELVEVTIVGSRGPTYSHPL
jgi:hypothetical protein